ncbi:hypothetical protein C5167_050624 [Papaver somniferum]|uniref:RRM domain-containing protein n=1 Tax=Papaver somniferum TaxID=3469 RepID=A0A4Y7KP60_PAPSO|nr:hypothetical protein C5167_050624 [Papaver somniferum]
METADVKKKWESSSWGKVWNCGVSVVRWMEDMKDKEMVVLLRTAFIKSQKPRAYIKRFQVKFKRRRVTEYSNQITVRNIVLKESTMTVFEPFGPWSWCLLTRDWTVQRVRFCRLEDARTAQSLNGKFNIARRIIKVAEAAVASWGNINPWTNCNDGLDQWLQFQLKLLMTKSWACSYYKTTLQVGLSALAVNIENLQ